MHGTTELKVAAESYREIVQTAEFPLDCEKVGESLGRMGVAAVTCIDYRNTGNPGGNERCSFDRVTHCNHVCKAVDDAGGILDGLTLGH